MVIPMSASSYQEKLKDARTVYLEGKDQYANEDYTSALRSFQKAVEVHESVLGKYHQDTIKTY